MLVPKRVKYRRPHRGKMRGEAKGGKTVTFGEFGLQATESHWISNRQIEAARIAMTRHMKRGGQVWIKIFPHLSYTSKGVGVRMGNGKGTPDGWVAPVKRGKEATDKLGDHLLTRLDKPEDKKPADGEVDTVEETEGTEDKKD